MHVGLFKLKTQVYLLIVSLIISLLGMAIMRSSNSGPTAHDPKAMSTAQKLDALEKTEGQSPEMSKFLKHAKASQDANQEAADEMPR